MPTVFFREHTTGHLKTQNIVLIALCFVLNSLAIVYVFLTGGPWLEEYESLNVVMMMGKGGLPPLSYWTSNCYHFLVPLFYQSTKLASQYAYPYLFLYFGGVLAAVFLQLILAAYLRRLKVPFSFVVALVILLVLIFTNSVYIYFSSFKLAGLYTLCGYAMLAISQNKNKLTLSVSIVFIVIGSFLRVQVSVVVAFLFFILTFLENRKVPAYLIKASFFPAILLVLVYVVRVQSKNYEVQFDRNYEYLLQDRQDYRLVFKDTGLTRENIKLYAFASMINDSSQINSRFYDSIIEHHNWGEILLDKTYLLNRIVLASLTLLNYLKSFFSLIIIAVLIVVAINSRKQFLKQLVWLVCHLGLLLIIGVVANIYDRVYETFFLVYICGFILLLQPYIIPKYSRLFILVVYILIGFFAPESYKKFQKTVQFETEKYNEYVAIKSYLSSNQPYGKPKIFFNLSLNLFSNKLIDALPELPLYKRCVVLNFYWFSYVPFISEAFYNQYGVNINVFKSVIDYLIQQSPSQIVANPNQLEVFRLYIKEFYGQNLSCSRIKPITAEQSLFNFELNNGVDNKQLLK